MADGVVVSHGAAQELMAKVLEALNLPPDDARQVAGGLVWADLRGIDSHGMIRLSSELKKPSRKRARSALAG